MVPYATGTLMKFVASYQGRKFYVENNNSHDAMKQALRYFGASNEPYKVVLVIVDARPPEAE